MIISHSRQFIFVHIHKAGGTSVEQMLEPHLSWNDLVLGGSPFGEQIVAAYRKRFGLKKHSSVAEIEAICGAHYLENYFVFSLVRHPLARVCSLYNYIASMVNSVAQKKKIPLSEVAQHAKRLAGPGADAFAWPSTHVFLENQGFSEFIRHPLVLCSTGFRSQVNMLTRMSARRPEGTVFRLEDYPAWSHVLRARLGLDCNLPHANKSDAKRVKPKTVSAADKRFIKEIYREDYETFEYRS